MPRYHRVFDPGHLQFITSSTYRRVPVFAGNRVATSRFMSIGSCVMLTQFRAEFFNGWNHTQFGDANANLSSQQFGKITGLRTGPREIQFGLKLIF